LANSQPSEEDFEASRSEAISSFSASKRLASASCAGSGSSLPSAASAS
jgi:hypothetical protein